MLTPPPSLCSQEITINYGFETFGTKVQKCFCGTASCSGYLGGVDDEEWEVRCVCEDDCETEDMIACDVCNNWLHCKCIGLTEGEAENMDDFVCPICKSEGKTAQSLYAPNSGTTQLQRFTSSDAQAADDDEVIAPPPRLASPGRALGEDPPSSSCVCVCVCVLP
jgi:hypothetical protein